MEIYELKEKLTYLQKYAGILYGGTFKVDVADQETIRDCYQHLMRGQRLNMGCPECIKYALVVCISYYERESPNWNKEPQIETITEDEFFKDESPIEEKPQEEKPKKKTKPKD